MTDLLTLGLVALMLLQLLSLISRAIARWRVLHYLSETQSEITALKVQIGLMKHRLEQSEGNHNADLN